MEDPQGILKRLKMARKSNIGLSLITVVMQLFLAEKGEPIRLSLIYMHVIQVICHLYQVENRTWNYEKTNLQFI